MKKLLEQLNPVQREAVLYSQGPMMILAGAGSGKTKTLVTKIIYLLEEKNLSAHELLALTFSNKAAKEMRERVILTLGEEAEALQITTFHAFCARLLRSEANYLGLSRNFSIYDDGESKAVVKALLERRGISTKEINPYEILNYIDGLKNNGFYLGKEESELDQLTIDRDDEYYVYFEEYEAELHRANAIDFSGLITGVLALFEKFPDVLKRYQKRFKYVLVDEYQDTNRAQFLLVKLLCEERQNICVVGDEDQSIYSWRGADIRNILDFEKIFPQVHLLKLEQNYRSSKTIIEAATCVIKKNTLRKGKEMWTENPEGDVIEIVECFNDKDEASFIASEIVKLHTELKVEYRDMAVFYRSNAQARQIEDALRMDKVHYRVIGGIKFYERKEIKDLLAYFRLVVNSKDSLALSRVINVPARGIGATTLRKLEIEAVNEQCSLWDVVEKCAKRTDETSSLIKLSTKVRSALNEFVSLINEIKVLESTKVKPTIIYQKILSESGYHGSLVANRDYETEARLENLDELLNAIAQYEDTMPQPTLTGFLETITLDSQHTDQSEDQNKNASGEVSLMTIHGAKGLEFTHVFVAGVEENIFPSFKSVENGELAMEEERRLFYVAMTRAMEKLYITYAQGRMLFGQIKFNGPSRFIDEIPNDYYHLKKLKGRSLSSSHQSFDDVYNFDQSTHYEDHETKVIYQVKKEQHVEKRDFYHPKFPVGSKVIHSLYGTGNVENTEGSGAEEKVLIRFVDGNRKKFMVKFAPITLA